MKVYIVMETNTIFAVTENEETAIKFLKGMEKIQIGNWYIIQKDITTKLPDWMNKI